jgi:hypothetical protein
MATDRLGVVGGGASRSIWDRPRNAAVYSQRLKRRLVMTRQSFGLLRLKPGNRPGASCHAVREIRGFRLDTECHSRDRTIGRRMGKELAVIHPRNPRPIERAEVRSGSRLCENAHQPKMRGIVFLYCLLATERASTTDFRVKEIEIDFYSRTRGPITTGVRNQRSRQPMSLTTGAAAYGSPRARRVRGDGKNPQFVGSGT